MERSRLLAFAAAYLAVVVLPGPGVAALVARVMARGAYGAPAYIAGCAAGALLWFIVAVTGLAAVAASLGTVFVAVRYAGVAYLLYLAWRFWTSAARPLPVALVADPSRKRWRMFLTGLSVTLGNPKAVVFFLALLPTVIDVPALRQADVAMLGAAIVTTLSGVYAVYALSAARARRLFNSPRAMRLVNRGSGVAMAGAPAAIAAR